ncbi:gliding motility-associated C-terminal domain-containing protein [Myroides odoratus]|uniref:Gliding motility-associated C-terminal domain n=1 Tax=Myroides odoratus TaxID=256 RepID=A0A378RKE8_MYROD|nr:gliding motility-associated C-terminal domain-containing protein [Myroides odoratus]QQU05067.1 gliding motility-associated C-terminal domain-containing protein [Myroides odoratus]STZ27455.1 gliding motility-associated C-terminal domain [Myroides odoratus]
MKKAYIKLTFFTLCSSVVLAQENQSNHFVNTGELVVAEGTILSSDYAFENSALGNFENHGQIYYYNDFQNDNLFYPGTLTKNAKVFFSPKDAKKTIQISGNKLTEFQNVEFNHAFSDLGFSLSNEISVKGESNFVSGIIQVEEERGMFTFLSKSTAINASDLSHVSGPVEKQGSQAFDFPIGDGGYHRPAAISAPAEEMDVFVSQYRLATGDFFEKKANVAGVIQTLNTKEYWELTRSDNKTKDVLLTLSWDERTTDLALLKDPEKELHIVRWDEKQQLWVDEGGVVNMSRRTITTATQVKGYGYFTLASVKTNLILEGDLVIYNFVSTNGDGKNDYFLIDNITRFPNNTVEIYNRWGIKVFDTTNYDSTGNIFKGYSDGRVTLKKGEQLPSGTYFYVITYEYEDSSGSRKVKKSGYLHLETN